MEDEELFLSPAPKKKKKKRERSFLDAMLEEEASRSKKVESLREETAKSLSRLACFDATEACVEVDWGYVNGTRTPPNTRSSEDFGAEDERIEGIDEVFDDVVGARLPRLVRSPAAEIFACPREGVGQVLAQLEEPELAEALCQGYVAAYVAATGDEATPAFARWLHLSTAFDPRDAIAEGAAKTLAGLARCERQKRPLATRTVLDEVFGPYLELGGGYGGETEAARVARTMAAWAACLEHKKDDFDAESAVSAVRRAVAASTDHAIATSASLGRSAARRLATAAIDRAADLRAAGPILEIPPHAGSTFTPEDAVWPVAAVRAIPPREGEREASGLAASAIAQILVDHVLQGTKVNDIKLDLPDHHDGLKTILAAIHTMERDVGGGNTRVPILGSHERTYAALAAVHSLYFHIAPDLTHHHNAKLLQAGEALRRRFRNDMDATAVRSNDLVDVLNGHFKRAAQPPVRTQATLTTLLGDNSTDDT